MNRGEHTMTSNSTVAANEIILTCKKLRINSEKSQVQIPATVATLSSTLTGALLLYHLYQGHFAINRREEKEKEKKKQTTNLTLLKYVILSNLEQSASNSDSQPPLNLGRGKSF